MQWLTRRKIIKKINVITTILVCDTAGRSLLRTYVNGVINIPSTRVFNAV